MTYEMKLQEMQDFGYNKGKTDGKIEGKFEGKIESIKELMRTLDLSPEKAMKALYNGPLVKTTKKISKRVLIQ